MSELNIADVESPVLLKDFIRLRANALDDVRDKRHKGFIAGVAGSIATAAAAYSIAKGWPAELIAGETGVSVLSLVTCVEYLTDSVASTAEATAYNIEVMKRQQDIMDVAE
jgi:hypothetical protein